MCISRPSPGEHLYQKNLSQPAAFLSFCDSQLRPVSPCEYASGLSPRVRRFRRSYGVRRRWWCSDPRYPPLPRPRAFPLPPFPRTSRFPSSPVPPGPRALPISCLCGVGSLRSGRAGRRGAGRFAVFVRPRPPSGGAGEAFPFPLFAEVASTPSAIPSFSSRRGRAQMLR